jgi:hypothetical protein
MTNSSYPTEAQLHAMGQTVQKDICLWSARLDREYRNVHSAPIYTRSEPDPLPERPRGWLKTKFGGRRIA